MAGTTTTESDAQVGFGAEIGYKFKGVGTTYKPLAELISVEGPGPSVGKVETTRLSSKHKTSAPTRPENEITFNIQHIGKAQGCIDFASYVKEAPVPYLDIELTYPDGFVSTFWGFPTTYTTSGVEGEAVIMAAVAFTINSPIATVDAAGVAVVPSV